MPAKSAITNTAVQLTTASAGNTGLSGIRLEADAGNSNTVYYGFANTITLPLANGNTTAEMTVGFPLRAGVERIITRAEFQRYYGQAQVPDASKLYVIATAANQRVFWEPLGREG